MSILELPLGVEYFAIGTVSLLAAAALLGSLRYHVCVRLTGIVVGGSILILSADQFFVALTRWHTVLPLRRFSDRAPIIRVWENPGVFWFSVMLWSILVVFAVALIWFTIRGDPARVESVRSRLVRGWPITLLGVLLYGWAGLGFLPMGWELLQNPWLENALPARRLMP
ncbi:MAG: hypothetical protein KDH20_23330 [Rhodocyclaceae bacterium]|nr:hypothetical protein [Rhodocyclaceae bacterium]